MLRRHLLRQTLHRQNALLFMNLLRQAAYLPPGRLLERDPERKQWTCLWSIVDVHLLQEEGVHLLDGWEAQLFWTNVVVSCLEAVLCAALEVDEAIVVVALGFEDVLIPIVGCVGRRCSAWPRGTPCIWRSPRL